MIPGSSNPLMMAAAPAGALQISRSLRFNSSDSGFLSRTPAVAGNRRTWTWSGWVKRSALGSDAGNAEQYIFRGGTDGSSSQGAIIIGSDTLYYIDNYSSYPLYLQTTQVLRDPSAWYHILVAIDTTQATSSNRGKLYINGTQVTTLATAFYPSQNYDTFINSAESHTIGRRDSSFPRYFSGYLTNIHLIDGQQLTPSSFTETDATTGQLIPKTYTGSYGTNGFNLLFADNSSNTASTLGKDTSPNGNNFTPNNLSVTAGAGNDSLVDSPTNYGTDTGVGGEVRGNYATLNPIYNAPTLNNGNLQVTGASNAFSTIYASSGKWYAEFTMLATPGVNWALCGISIDATTASSGWRVIRSSDGQYYDGSSYAAYGNSWTTNDVIGVAVDVDNSTLEFLKNGTSQGQKTGLSLSGKNIAFLCSPTGGGAGELATNFGQRAFAYTAPSGFKALNTQNLPEGTITTSGTYTGNGVADGPFVYLNGVPTAMTVGVNAVTFGTHADKLSNGFKLRTTNVLYNQNALSYSYSITTTGAKFKYARAQPNP